MNKSELVNEVSEETTFSKKDVARVLESVIRTIQRALKKGERVSLPSFGSWDLSRRKARKGINPATRETIDLPAVTVARFRAGKSLREDVKSVKVGS